MWKGPDLNKVYIKNHIKIAQINKKNWINTKKSYIFIKN